MGLGFSVDIGGLFDDSLLLTLLHMVRSSLVAQSHGVKSHASEIQARHIYVAPRLHRPQSIEDNTSRLIAEITLNSQQHPKRVTHSHREKKKKMGEKRKKHRKRSQKRAIKPMIKLLYENAY